MLVWATPTSEVMFGAPVPVTVISHVSPEARVPRSRPLPVRSAYEQVCEPPLNVHVIDDSEKNAGKSLSLST